MAKKPKNSGLSEFFDESVPASALSAMKRNTAFLATDNGEPVYLCVRLETSVIGGIDAKTKKDKVIGGIINGVTGGLIDAYVTTETNANNQLVFIPTPKTLDYIADFSKFTTPDWELVKVKDDGSITGTGMAIKYRDMLEVSKQQKSIGDFLTDIVATQQAQARAAKQAAAKPAPSSQPAPAKQAEPVYHDDNMFPDDDGLDEFEDFGDDMEPVQPDAENGEPEPEFLVTEDQVMQAITRTFFADDLNFTVSTEAFDQAFVVGNSPIQFALNESFGFVDSAMNQRVISMNQYLEQLHTQNLVEARQMYLNLLGKRIGKIQEDTDTEDSSTEWGSRKRAIELNRDQRLGSAEVDIERRRKELNEAYNARMEEDAAAAASAAKARFRQRFQKQHEEDLFAVDAKVRSEIQSDFSEALHELYTNRRSRAMSLLDLNIDGALNEMTETYREMFNKETEVYNNFAAELDSYINQLHIEAAQRAVIEEERLRQTNMANEVRDEMTSKLNAMEQEFTARISALEIERDTAVRNADEIVALTKQANEDNMEQAKKREEALQEQLDKSIVRFQEAEANVKRDYEHRMEQARDSELSWRNALETYEAQHKRHNRIVAVLILAIVAACLAGGFVLGNLYYSRVARQTTYDDIVEQWQPNEDGEIERSDDSIANADDDTEDNAEANGAEADTEAAAE